MKNTDFKGKALKISKQIFVNFTQNMRKVTKSQKLCKNRAKNPEILTK